MSKVIVITGSSSGMGLASKDLLSSSGATIIGISNTPGEDIQADLSTDEGVDAAVEAVKKISNGKIDAVFANAGVDSEHAPLVFGLNYFGVVRFLTALRPLLLQSADPRVLINASNSVVITPGMPLDVVQALLEFDKNKAYELIKKNAHWTYQVSKVAITQWARKVAADKDWAGSGISMNIMAPGVVLTPLIEHDLKDPRKAAGINRLPKPIGDFPKPENITPLVKFLLMDDSRYIVGQFIIIDGGTEASLRHSEYPQPWNITLDEFRNKY